MGAAALLLCGKFLALFEIEITAHPPHLHGPLIGCRAAYCLEPDIRNRHDQLAVSRLDAARDLRWNASEIV